MQSSTELLTDAAFFQEAADFLDMNDLSPTSTLFSNIEAIPKTSEAVALSDDTSVDERDLAIVALRSHREKEKLRRRKQRQRVKDELETLRRTEGELSLQLKKLKYAKEKKNLSRQEYSIWKEIALTNREERLRSETEQRRLTATATAQASYIENLRGLFRLHQNAVTLKNATQCSELPSSQFGTSDAPLFTSLLQKIDTCYTRIDDILNECGIATMPLGVVNSMYWRDANGELEYHQNLHKFVKPFDLETTQRSCWKSLDIQHHQRDRESYDVFGDPDNTVVIKYRLIRTLASGATVSVVQRLVARRFIEQDRVVGICKKYTEGEGSFRGMHSIQTGWSCLRQLPDGSGTLGEHCIRQFPVLFNSLRSAASDFQQFILATLDEDKYETMTVVDSNLPVGKQAC